MMEATWSVGLPSLSASSQVPASFSSSPGPRSWVARAVSARIVAALSCGRKGQAQDCQQAASKKPFIVVSLSMKLTCMRRRHRLTTPSSRTGTGIIDMKHENLGCLMTRLSRHLRFDKIHKQDERFLPTETTRLGRNDIRDSFMHN